jgi:hypothetical protein
MLKEEEEKSCTGISKNIMTDSAEGSTLNANCQISSEKIANEVTKMDKSNNGTSSPRSSILKQKQDKCITNTGETMATGSTLNVNVKGD